MSNEAKMVEKPAPAKGQRWQHKAGNIVWTVTGVEANGAYPVLLDNGGAWERDMRDLVYLGSPSPSPVSAVAATPGIAPATRGARHVELRFMDTSEWRRYPGHEYENIKGWKYKREVDDAGNVLRSATEIDGAYVEAPRTPVTPSVQHDSVAAPGSVLGVLPEASGRPGAPPPAAVANPRGTTSAAGGGSAARYNLAAKAGAELHTQGRPHTALEAIRERKPPAPWVPSVDDFDLLPDAGTSCTSPSRGGR